MNWKTEPSIVRYASYIKSVLNGKTIRIQVVIQLDSDSTQSQTKYKCFAWYDNLGKDTTTQSYEVEINKANYAFDKHCRKFESKKYKLEDSFDNLNKTYKNPHELKPVLGTFIGQHYASDDEDDQIEDWSW